MPEPAPSFILQSRRMALQTGKQAPNIKSASFDLAKLRGKTVVIFFFPKADTPGCTAQACSLRDSYDDLRTKGLQIIGVSEDKAEAQKKFQEKYKLPFSLVADVDGSVAKAFGVPALGGFAKRQSFLIKDGKIVWRDLNASTKNQAADVRQALANLTPK